MEAKTGSKNVHKRKKSGIVEMITYAYEPSSVEKTGITASQNIVNPSIQQTMENCLPAHLVDISYLETYWAEWDGLQRRQAK